MSIFTKKDFTNIVNKYGNPKLPPGQLHTDKFPVLTYGATPNISKEDWKFEIRGLVKEKLSWSYAEFLEMPISTMCADFHCVTHWSRFDDNWQGILFKDFWEIIKDNILPNAKFVTQHAYGGYTTNLPLEQMLNEDVMFAFAVNDQLLEAEHGGPMRVFTPRRYAWKGAKWIKALEFLETDKLGFWEQNGYNNSADPWLEERYWD